MSRFGGHQTFYVRDGWLYKGLELLLKDPDLLTSDTAFDHLGVGKNMAKSIEHWLLATGIAERGPSVKGRRTTPLGPTDLARLIWENDKYLSHPETWWLLHTNLLHARDFAETWYWFFNEYNADRFDREACIRKLVAHATNDLPGNTPSAKTLERDFSCLANTYATEVPGRNLDPEDDIACPFRDLDLVVHYRESGNLAVQRRRRSIDPSVFMYALERCLAAADSVFDEDSGATTTDIRFFDLSRLPNNPMRVFLLTTDDFFESLVDLERDHPQLGVRVVGLAGDRQIGIERRPNIEWARSSVAPRKEVA